MNTVVDRQVQAFRDQFQAVREEISRIIVGNDDIVTGVMTCLLARGHVLLEGIPGVGKTKLVQTMADVLHLKFSRIQFTPDLMPGDIIGTNIVREDESGRKNFEFQQGPIFANMVLADEINRATPKTQSALLEAMQENSVSAAGRTFALDQPFFVLATQNPIEQTGTYPLPEAQLDRFLFKLQVGYPTADQEVEVLSRHDRGLDPHDVEAAGVRPVAGPADLAAARAEVDALT
ncbi:MAG TPA: AAA family ATPase, partial [Burkholderiales bacterium]|nr:AAA family ATPase [Burkholderiales bacterium]